MLPTINKLERQGRVVEASKNSRCCYADASRAAIEGAIAIATGQLKLLSTQELRSPTYKSFALKINPSCYKYGMGGGFEEYCYEYVYARGLSTALQWPMTLDSPIRRNMPRVWIDGYVVLPPDDEELFLRAIAQQPVTAVLSVNEMAKVRFPDVPYDTNDYHTVLLIGYDVSCTSKVVTFQNNWGDDWETGGCGTLSLDGLNDCGVKQNVCYPVLDKFPSALNSELENAGRLTRRSPLGVPAYLRFPYVFGGSFIGIKYNKGIIVSSDNGGHVKVRRRK